MNQLELTKSPYADAITQMAPLNRKGSLNLLDKTPTISPWATCKKRHIKNPWLYTIIGKRQLTEGNCKQRRPFILHNLNFLRWKIPSLNLSLSYAVNPQECLAWNFSLQYHPWIKHSGHENEENDHQLKRIAIVQQILLISTLGNV